MSREPGPETFRSFLVLWTFQAISILGTQAVQFALIWWLAAETGSAGVLATAALAGLVPQVVLGPFAGALVDRWDRRRVMLAADGATAACSLVLAGLFAAGLARPEFVYLALLARSLGSAFHQPAMLASTSLMVPGAHLTRIQGLNQALQGGLLILAAPLGGILLAALPMGGVLLIDVVTAALAMTPLAFIRIPSPPSDSGAAPIGLSLILGDVREAMRHLAGRPGHVGIVALGTVINMFVVPAFSLLPLLVTEELGGGAMHLAGMNSAIGAGTIAGGILLGAWGGFRKRIATTLAGLAGFGLAVLALGVAPGVAMATVAMGCIGLLLPVVNGPILAILQATISPALQGRVFTLLGSLAGLAAPLGLLLAAPVAELAGVRAWYVAGALACLSMAVAGALFRPIREIEADAGAEAPALSPSGSPARPCA